MKSLLRSPLPVALALCLLSGPALAAADDWITVKAGKAFTFEAPADIQPIPVQGIDSFVGQYGSARFSLLFDYGAYSNSLGGPDENPGFDIEKTMIDGRRALIITGPARDASGDCEFETDVYVVVQEGSPPPVALTMTACSNGYAGVVQLHRLFKSLKFSQPAA